MIRTVQDNKESLKENDKIISFSCRHKKVNGDFELVVDTIVIKELPYKTISEKLDNIKKEILRIKFRDTNIKNIQELIIYSYN